MSRAEQQAQWRDRLRRFRKSGQSAAEFCRHEGVSDATFYKWKNRLGAAPRADKVSFVEVSRPPEGRFEVAMPTGVVVRVPPEYDEDALVRLLKALGRCA